MTMKTLWRKVGCTVAEQPSRDLRSWCLNPAGVFPKAANLFVLYIRSSIRNWTRRRAMRWCKIAVCVLVAVSLAVGQSSRAANDSAEQLPVTRVILYKNGIGYFEHAGRVRGSQDVNLDFTTAQLNDVVKSLTVLDLGQRRVRGVC